MVYVGRTEQAWCMTCALTALPQCLGQRMQGRASVAAQHLRAQVRGELLTSDGRTLASVSRPCLLPHRSPVVRMFRRGRMRAGDVLRVSAHRHPGVLGF